MFRRIVDPVKAEWVIDAVRSGPITYHQAATVFGVSKISIERWMKGHVTVGTAAQNGMFHLRGI